MSKNWQLTSIDWVNQDSPSIQYISWKKVLPLEWRIKKRISKLNLSNDYDWRVQNDVEWIQMESEVIPPRRKKKKKIYYDRVLTDYDEQALMFEEVANTILRDPLLSQPSWNPGWYPPVPTYTPPKWRKFSAQEIHKAKSRKVQSSSKEVNSDFVKYNVVITPCPMQVSEFDSAVQSVDSITWWWNLSSIWQDVEVITWFKESELCSIPVTTSMVWFRVNFILTWDNKKELAWLYVFEKPMIINNLITRLDTLEVTNIVDLRATKDTLLQKLKELESKS